MVDVDDDKPSPERTQTDESLKTERSNADKVLSARQADAQAAADEIVQVARDTADAVLVAAREQADDRLEQTAPRKIIAQERVLEDTILRDERASADENLLRERQECMHTLARLLPMERQKTDRYLLTERRRSDEDIAQRDDFLGIVSHDLRNLLSGIVLTAAMLSEAPEAASRIERYAARMNRLIGDLLDIASIEAGKLSMSRMRGDTAALVDEAVDMFKGLAKGKDIVLESTVDDRPFPAEFDHDRMIQVLANLITNAIKFTAPGGSIIVRIENISGGPRFSVCDTGVGIESDNLERVFERFWHDGKADRRGVGLGLYISRCIVEAHGGTISVESTPGTGSTFSFTLG